MNGTMEELYELVEKDAIDLSSLSEDDKISLTGYIIDNLLEGSGSNDDGMPELANILRELGYTSEEDLDCIERFGRTYSDALEFIFTVYTNPSNPYGMGLCDYNIEDVAEHFDDINVDYDVQRWFLSLLDLNIDDGENNLPVLIYLKHPSLVEELGVYDSDTISKLRKLLPSSDNITSLEDLVEVTYGKNYVDSEHPYDTEVDTVFRALLKGDLSYEDVAPFILELQYYLEIYTGEVINTDDYCCNWWYENHDELCKLITILGSDYKKYLCSLNGFAYDDVSTGLSDGYYWSELGILNNIYLEDILTSKTLLVSDDKQFSARCDDGKIILSRILDSIEYCCSYYIDETVSIIDKLFEMFSADDLLSDIDVNISKDCMQELISNGLSLKVANLLV